MSDLCVYQLEDTVWDEFSQGDDYMVPYPCFDLLDNQTMMVDNDKKHHNGATSFTGSIVDGSAARYGNQGREQRGFSTQSKRRNTVSEKDSLCHSPTDVFPSSMDTDSVKEVSGLTYDDTRSSSQVAKSNNSDSSSSPGDSVCRNRITGHSGDNPNLFDSSEDKVYGDLLYYGWPEIGNFEDVDRMFRSSDSTFGPGRRNENELDRFLSTADIGGSGDVFGSDFKCSIPNSEAVVNNLGNHEDSKSYFARDSAMPSVLTKYRDSPWTTEKSEPYTSSVNGQVMADVSGGLIPKEQMDDHQKHFKVHTQFDGKPKEHCPDSGNFYHGNNMSNEVHKLPSWATSQQASQSVSSEDQFDDTKEDNMVVPEDLDSLNLRGSSTSSSQLDDTSLEASSFRQLQFVIKQLDLRTKLCIKDSLYRLARRAAERHNHVNLNKGRGDESDSIQDPNAEGANDFMEIETETNPVDRSVAHLLFHRSSESSHEESMQFKSPSLVSF